MHINSTDDLSSDRAIDYTRLRNLLKAGKWKDANYETYLVMLKVVGRKEGDWIRDSELGRVDGEYYLPHLVESMGSIASRTSHLNLGVPMSAAPSFRRS